MIRIDSTYRLQLRPDALTFADARTIADYLSKLGVSHLYLSPILTPMRGSTHGYDVADATKVATGLGGPGGFRALSDELRRRGMGIIVDIVPNHMGVSTPAQNRWWWDVLERGRASEFAGYFDIDWRPDNGADGKLALPVLNGPLDPIALGIDRSGPMPLLALGNMRFPLSPGTDRGGSPAQIHDRQHYRLVSWRDGIGTYRRFFAVNELAALRQENPLVFEATHRELAAWCAHDLIDGVRVDHPDGLAYPGAYLAKLRDLIGPNRLLLIEKILAEHEVLDPTLPVDGTTGYDALSYLGGVLIDPAGERTWTELSEQFAGTSGDERWLARAEVAAKRTVAQTLLAPEVRRLVAAIRRDAPIPPVDPDDLTDAVIELIAQIPVYRADYPVLAGTWTRAMAAVESERPELAAPLSSLTNALSQDTEASVRFQQVCGAVMAKAVEDSVFYRCVRLVSLAEVGGNPGRFARSVNEFHLANADRTRRIPAGMTTLSTHDTKRGEDVRARIGVLSQIADRWARHVVQWDSHTPGPDGETELFLLQNMFGIWPTDGTPANAVPGLRDRIHAYAEKAIREAGAKTSWATPNSDFERATHTWIDTVIDGEIGQNLSALATELAPHAWSDSLAQKLLQLCGPGIPDIYQGTEWWEDALVDPDNRRLVDFPARADMLAALTDTPRLDGTGAAKIWIVAHALWARREYGGCFVGGSYTPLYAAGPATSHLIAYARGHSPDRPGVIAAVTRHSVRLAETGWQETTLTLPDGDWTDRIGNRTHYGTIRLADLFADLPVALLTRG